MSILDRTDELLLACLTDNVGQHPGADPSPTEWDEMVERATAMDMGPFLLDRLRRGGREASVPPHLLEALQSRARVEAWHGVRLHQWLGRLLRALHDADVAVIPLKGAFLAGQVYVNVGLRQMADVDLLVHPQDRERVEQTLLAMGYSLGKQNTPEVTEWTRHNFYAPPKDAPPVEVHWSIHGGKAPWRVDTDGLWTRARPARVAGVEGLTLSPEDFLLHLCMHASQRHVFDFGLRPFCDVTETVRYYRDDLDWALLVQRARQWGVSRCVHLTLYVAKAWLGALVPDETLVQLGSGAPDPRLLAWIGARSFTPETAVESSPSADEVVGPASNPWGEIRRSRGFMDKVRVFLEACFPPPEVLADKYGLPSGSRRAYLYYPVHLKDLAVRHTLRAWRLLRHDAETERWLAREAARLEREAMQQWLETPDWQVAAEGQAAPPLTDH